MGDEGRGGCCLPAPCKHAAEGRQTFPPVYLSNIGSPDLGLVCVILCWRN